MMMVQESSSSGREEVVVEEAGVEAGAEVTTKVSAPLSMRH